MIFSDITIISDDQEMERTYAQIRMLLSCRKGTVPGARSFGLDGSWQDMPLPLAANMIGVELAEAMAEFVPSAVVKSVEPVMNADGTIDLKLTVERSDEV